ncbi:INT5 protein, partial [Atlantisia rogersi]|nr:INT5 protein [Atlantisia rogersi]
AAVHQFFQSLRGRRVTAAAYGTRLLARLSGVSGAAAKAVLQQLVEGALRGCNAELFGGQGGLGDTDEVTTPPASLPTPAASLRENNAAASVSLLDVNRRFTAAISFSGGGVWSVFHAGVIGKGLKPLQEAGEAERTEEELSHNTQTFLTLLIRCCSGGNTAAATNHRSPSQQQPPSQPPYPPINPEAAKAVAAALIESVCPEASGGGELIWPPEDQARATIERDLRICRLFR